MLAISLLFTLLLTGFAAAQNNTFDAGQIDGPTRGNRFALPFRTSFTESLANEKLSQMVRRPEGIMPTALWRSAIHAHKRM